MLRSALHVHTTYSDGELTLSGARELFAAAGCRVVCVTDHAEAFTPESVAAYVNECEALSDDRIRLVAGLEFGCHGRMHIIGYGVTDLTTSTDPQSVIQHIREAGGVAVIAHPYLEHFPYIETLASLPDGIEVWNSKYDGRFAPRPETFRLLQRLQARQPNVLAFYGLDLHWPMQFSRLFVDLECDDASREAVLAALSRGAFSAVRGNLVLPSDGAVEEALLVAFGRTNARSRRLRRAMVSMRRGLGRFGDHLPRALKSQLRRLF